MPQYDAIVCGSGITGGWAAKELTERGLKVLMVERGPNLEHRVDYKTEFKAPWELPFRGFTDPQILATSKRFQQYGRMDEWSKDMFVDDDVDVFDRLAQRKAVRRDEHVIASLDITVNGDERSFAELLGVDDLAVDVREDLEDRADSQVVSVAAHAEADAAGALAVLFKRLDADELADL
jgi:choline dehydrogenase-like flavoprotein